MSLVYFDVELSLNMLTSGANMYEFMFTDVPFSEPRRFVNTHGVIYLLTYKYSLNKSVTLKYLDKTEFKLPSEVPGNLSCSLPCGSESPKDDVRP